MIFALAISFYYPTPSILRPIWHSTGQFCSQMVGVARKQFQIRRMIVFLVFVAVMYDLFGKQIPPNCRLHHEAMLSHATGRVCVWVVGSMDQDISVRIRLYAALPCAVAMAGL